MALSASVRATRQSAPASRVVAGPSSPSPSSPGPSSPGPSSPRPADIGSALALLDLARSGLSEATESTLPTDRYAGAHLAALRSAAAVLALRGRPAGRRGPRSAWDLLPVVAPELAEWAAFFASGAAKRAAAEAGLARAVSTREADDLVRDSATFLALVETTLGLLAQPPVRRAG